jgi:hypothetical protein
MDAVQRTIGAELCMYSITFLAVTILTHRRFSVTSDIHKHSVQTRGLHTAACPRPLRHPPSSRSPTPIHPMLLCRRFSSRYHQTLILSNTSSTESHIYSPKAGTFQTPYPPPRTS